MAWMTRQEAADYLRISIAQLNRLGLPRAVIGRSPRYSQAMLDQHMAQAQWTPPNKKGGPRPPLLKLVRPRGDHLMQLKEEQRRWSRRARSR